jgi:CheY-like chemotaxis protein
MAPALKSDVAAPLEVVGARNDPLSILLAEDSRVSQALIGLVLRQRGHTVDAVDNGEEALTVLQKGNYDIALLDFHLPRMDGPDVVAAFKSNAKPDSKIPQFIGITADIKGLLSRPGGLRQTFDLVMPKPVDIVHLCNIVEKFDEYMNWTRRGGDTEGPTPVEVGPKGKERRHYERLRIARGVAVMTLSDGVSHDCRVLDLSLGGAALEMRVRPAIGEQVRVGRTMARVVRHTQEGVAIEFVRESRSPIK